MSVQIVLALSAVSLQAGLGGELLGAFVMPHGETLADKMGGAVNHVLSAGGIALDPSHFNTTNTTAKAEAWALHKACQEVLNPHT